MTPQLDIGLNEGSLKSNFFEDLFPLSNLIQLIISEETEPQIRSPFAADHHMLALSVPGN